jgi:hypothetical protein
MLTYKMHSFDSAKGIKEIGIISVDKRENLGTALSLHGYVKDALLVHGKGLTVVLTQGKKYLLDEVK